MSPGPASSSRLEAFRLAYADEPDRVVRGVVTRPVDVERPPAVLVVHGFKGFLRWGFFPEWQRRIADRGWASVAINLSGSGVGEDLESFTEDDAFFRCTPSRDVEDVESLRAAIERGSPPPLAGLDTSRLAVFGHSRGGGSVLLHAARRGDYRAVVTWASVDSTNRFGEEEREAWRARGVTEIPNARTGQVHRLGVGYLEDAEARAQELDVRAACARLRTPTLLVHGTDDESVPVSEGHALHAAYGGGPVRLLTIDGAGHTFGAVHPFAGTTPELERAMEASLDFLEEHL